jgi:Zn-dependent protease
LDTNLIFSVISCWCFIPAIVVHEVAHGFVAYKLGDPTAKSMGRLSFNPIKHIDPFGTVILPIMLALTSGMVFGYAKPVPYNPRYFKDIRKGELLTGLAGPASNLVMALIGAVVWLLIKTFFSTIPDPTILYWVGMTCLTFSMINLVLMFFNLIPLPPLDGSSIIAPFLNDKALHKYYEIQRYSMPILIILVFIVPYVSNMIGVRFDPLGLYLNATAGNLTSLLFGV